MASSSSRAAEIQRLGHDAAIALTAWRASATHPSKTVAEVGRVELAVARACSIATSTALDAQPYFGDLIRDDLERVATLTQSRRKGAAEALGAVADRLMHTAAWLSAITCSGSGGAESERVTDAAAEIGAIAASYGADARAQRWTARALYVLVGAIALGAVVVALIGLGKAKSGSRFEFEVFAAYGAVALTVIGLAFGVLWQATRERRNAGESARLQRQLVGVHAYTEDMPEPLRALLRATMAQQLFPRILEDNQPWRDAPWPASEALLAAIRDGYAVNDQSVDT